MLDFNQPAAAAGPAADQVNITLPSSGTVTFSAGPGSQAFSTEGGTLFIQPGQIVKSLDQISPPADSLLSIGGENSEVIPEVPNPQ
jgi:hypothetical protein